MNTQPIKSILVLNCGSSSIKFCLIQKCMIAQGMIENIGQSQCQLQWSHPKPTPGAQSYAHADHGKAMQIILQALDDMGHLPSIVAVGHRVVHGGTDLHQATTINSDVLKTLKSLCPLAPLHNPANIIGIEMAQQQLPNVPHVAVFDTGFHQSLPPHAFHYAIPKPWYQEHQVRRFGFHGISHQYIAEETARRLQKPITDTQIISAHLGNGGSVCAIKHGQSVDISMGLTPLEGLVMGTRCGDLDPGVHAYLCEQLGIDIQALNQQLNKASGLLGLSGLSHDMRSIEQAANDGHQDAKLALDVYNYKLAKVIASMLGALDRLDALVFTGGIGENACAVRWQSTQHLKSLGLALDETRNQNPASHPNNIAHPHSRCPIMVIATQEEQMIAQQVQTLLENHHD